MPEVAVPASPVVENLEVVEHGRPSLEGPDIGLFLSLHFFIIIDTAFRRRLSSSPRRQIPTDALNHRTNTGPRIRQTAIRVSDIYR